MNSMKELLLLTLLAISQYIILLNHILEYPFPEEWVFYFISVTSDDVAFLA